MSFSEYDPLYDGPPSEPDRITFRARTRREWAEGIGMQPGDYRVLRCEYCGTQGLLWWQSKPRLRFKISGVYFIESAVGDRLHWEHRVARSAGGLGTIDNIAIACQPCNSSKFGSSLPDWAVRLTQAGTERGWRIALGLAPCLALKGA